MFLENNNNACATIQVKAKPQPSLFAWKTCISIFPVEDKNKIGTKEKNINRVYAMCAEYKNLAI